VYVIGCETWRSRLRHRIDSRATRDYCGEAMKLNLDADNPADREKLRRAVLDLVAGRKMPNQKDASLSR
jgi:hypothetical protein